MLDTPLSPPDMAALTEACDAYVSLHRSEGFGLTIAEAMLRDKPVVATAYSGPRDWLSERNCFEVDWREVPIGPGNEPYPAEGTWAEPDLDDAAAQLRRVVDEPDEARRRAERGHADVRAALRPGGGRRGDGGAPGASGGPAAAAATARRPRSTWRRRCAACAASRPSPARTRPCARCACRCAARCCASAGPQATHQRLVDEELVRLVRTLDERVEGLAQGQTSLRAELEDIKRQLDR